MEKISRLLQENNPTLNVKKTVFMCFSNRNKTEKKMKIKVLNEEIGEVNEVSFLGVVLDSQLKNDKHINRLSKTV